MTLKELAQVVNGMVKHGHGGRKVRAGFSDPLCEPDDESADSLVNISDIQSVFVLDGEIIIKSKPKPQRVLLKEFLADIEELAADQESPVVVHIGDKVYSALEVRSAVQDGYYVVAIYVEEESGIDSDLSYEEKDN